MRAPNLTHADWQCDRCGPGMPMHVPVRINPEVVSAVVSELARDPVPVP
jgi:hypothetical protein